MHSDNKHSEYTYTQEKTQLSSEEKSCLHVIFGQDISFSKGLILLVSTRHLIH